MCCLQETHLKKGNIFLFILFMGFSRQEYWSGLPFPSPVDHILSDLSTMTCPSWVAPRAWLSFIELDKAVVLVWLDWLVSYEYGFSVFALWCPLATPTVLLGFLLPWAWGTILSLYQICYNIASVSCLGSLAVRHVGSYLSNQGSNLYPLHWKVNSQPLDCQGSPNIFQGEFFKLSIWGQWFKNKAVLIEKLVDSFIQ